MCFILKDFYFTHIRMKTTKVPTIPTFNQLTFDFDILYTYVLQTAIFVNEYNSSAVLESKTKGIQSNSSSSAFIRITESNKMEMSKFFIFMIKLNKFFCITFYNFNSFLFIEAIKFFSKMHFKLINFIFFIPNRLEFIIL